ncbi:WXG100 family type VII secretion target [Lentzea sp. NPDC058450]|uniref:WXG100 family type VII secretion target n=1 Tax=Lentzea sp. NPDC058450 TaxID=3346505 RepID=UPI00366A43BB
MSGFEVDAEELTAFAGKLDGHKGTAGQIAGLVDKADVGDKSWGIVGLFVKDEYDQMLGDLKELMKDLQTGLQSAGDKFRGTAQGYQEQEDALKAIFSGVDIDFSGK